MSGERGVYLALVGLSVLVVQLRATLDEFEDAVDTRKDLQKAVGRPDGRGGLRSKVGAFEDKWNNTRGDLKDGISKVRDHLSDIIESFENLDGEMGAQYEDLGSALRPPALSRRVGGISW